MTAHSGLPHRSGWPGEWEGGMSKCDRERRACIAGPVQMRRAGVGGDWEERKRVARERGTHLMGIDVGNIHCACSNHFVRSRLRTSQAMGQPTSGSCAISGRVGVRSAASTVRNEKTRTKREGREEREGRGKV